MPTQLVNRSAWNETFSRELLNPANAIPIYTVTLGGTGGGSGVITQMFRLLLTTDSTASGDDVDVRSIIALKRSYSDDGIQPFTTTVTMDVMFNLGGTVTNTEGFIGLTGSAAALSALPTTVRSLGIFWDLSANANFFLTSANGTTQVTTDTTIAADDTFCNDVSLRFRLSGL